MYNIKNISETFVFDKYYSTLYGAKNNAETDNILPGRYILIKYTEELFSSEDKKRIKNSGGSGLQSVEEKDWWDKWQIDIKIYLNAEIERDFDRAICQKVFENGNYTYLPIYSGESTAVLEWEKF